MRHLLLLVTLLLAGCGERLSGRYEARNDIPHNSAQGLSGNFESAIAQVNAMNVMTLEFSGSKVTMGSPLSKMEYSYTVKDDHLDLELDAGGAVSHIPMTINPDGSISYLTMRFQRVQ